MHLLLPLIDHEYFIHCILARIIDAVGGPLPVFLGVIVPQG